MASCGIEMIQVSKEYPLADGQAKTVLRDISLTIKQGEFVGLAGSNGAGKSTIARLINGLISPSAGRVLVNGMDTADQGSLTEIRRSVGMVFQNPDNQIVSSVVEEDIAFGPENLGMSAKEVKERTEWALSAVGLTELRDRAPNLLSGGQKQKVAIAGALAMRPSHLILDEPTSMLDPWGRQELLRTLGDLNRQYGITVVLISHHMEDLVHGDRLVVLDKGRIALDDAPRKLFAGEVDLSVWGLGTPDGAYLAAGLKKKGYPVDQPIVTAEEMVDYICRSLK